MSLPNMIAVNSTNLESVGHNGQNLFVRFKNGSIYVYFNVPTLTFQGLLNAGSKGTYLNQHIKGIFPYERIA